LQYKKEKTPLENTIDKFSVKLGYGTLGICFGIFIINIIPSIVSGSFTYQLLIDYFIVAIALAVAAIPEGLATVVTITLAIGVEKMARNNAIVRRLPSVETLGCTNVICTDKTGTLTKNEMTVTKIYVGGKFYSVSGIGYDSEDGNVNSKKDELLGVPLFIGKYCNTTSLVKENNQWTVIGDPTEAALLVVADRYVRTNYKSEGDVFASDVLHYLVSISSKNKDLQGKKPTSDLTLRLVRKYPFDSDRKQMSIVYEIVPKNKKLQLKRKYILVSKGALSSIIKNSKYCMDSGIHPLTHSKRENILSSNDAMARSGLRVLAFGYRFLTKIPRKDDLGVEQDLVFAGLMGMMDPPRDGVLDAVADAKKAGIDVVMITGDQKDTAISIGMHLGILPKDWHGKYTVIGGAEMDTLTDEDLSKQIDRLKVVYRASPTHKVRILDAFKRKRYVVAMTGDGVNDAPVLKKSDVGVAMGLAGTDVAKEASDLILQDDNFSTIIKAVAMGRAIYQSIYDFIIYTMSSNLAEIFVILFGTLLGWPLPLTAIQILWMNLVTDGVPGLALGMDKPVRDLLKDKPRPRDKPILDRFFVRYTLVVSVIIGVLSLASFYIFSDNFSNVPMGRTMALNVIVLMEMANVLNLKTRDKSWLPDAKNGYYTVLSVILTIFLQFAIIDTGLNVFFKLVQLNVYHWILSLGIVIVGYFIIRITSFYLVKFRE